MRLGQLPTSGLHASAGAQSGDKTALIDGFAAGLKCLQRDKDADFRSGATDWVLQGSRLDWGRARRCLLVSEAPHYGQGLRRRGVFGIQRRIMMAGRDHSGAILPDSSGAKLMGLLRRFNFDIATGFFHIGAHFLLGIG